MQVHVRGPIAHLTPHVGYLAPPVMPRAGRLVRGSRSTSVVNMNLDGPGSLVP